MSLKSDTRTGAGQNWHWGKHVGQTCHTATETGSQRWPQRLRSLSNVWLWCHAWMYRAVILSKQTDCQHDKVDINTFLDRDGWSVGGGDVTEPRTDAGSGTRNQRCSEAAGKQRCSHSDIFPYWLAIPSNIPDLVIARQVVIIYRCQIWVLNCCKLVSKHRFLIKPITPRMVKRSTCHAFSFLASSCEILGADRAAERDGRVCVAGSYPWR